MYFRIIYNDILKSKAITFITMIFIAVASMLVSLAAILFVNLTGSIDTLMTKAKTPHFLQMHSGEIDMEGLRKFARQNNAVDDFQVLEFINIDGVEIIINGRSLADSVQDNGFSIQSEKFDYLLDLDGNIIKVSDGELYVPISYMKDNTAKIGDKAVILGKEFIVKGFLRDSQMNSTLSSSKRFLLSKNDYEQIKGFGNIEYLIEFRLKDLSMLGSFETAYTEAGLEVNGPTITYPLFKLINAISDGLMIALIFLVSILVVIIAFMCIRFTLLTKIEEDYGEIGVMKAIGLPVWDIKRLYLAKYAVVAGGGCILGFMLSIIFRGILLENIRLYMGESEHSSIALLYGIIGVILVFFAVITYVNCSLKGFRKVSASQAIRFGFSQEKITGVMDFPLSKNSLLDINVFLGIKDVLTRKRLYTTMFAILVISAFIIIVPQNLYSTISSNDFIGYMGIGDCDLYISIQQTDNIIDKAREITQAMESDPDILKYAVLTTKTFTIKRPDGLREGIKIELGDHLAFPVEYHQGRAPLAEDEIALSILNAKELGISAVGDSITLISSEGEQQLIVCGIYSDIINGGKTAKARFNDNSTDIMWHVICAKLTDKSLINSKVSEYGEKYSFAKVIDIDERILQIFGSTITSVKKAALTAVALALLITVLIILLFMKMLIVKDRYSIAVMKALGFINRDIKIQYISRSVLVLTIGLVLGTVLANTLGELLARTLISSFGVSSFKFVINPILAYLLSPLMLLSAVLIATRIGISRAGDIKIAHNIKE